MKKYLISLICLLVTIVVGCQSSELNLVEEIEHPLAINEVIEAELITSPAKIEGKINFYYMNNQATPYLDFNQFLSKFPRLFGENMKVERGETDIMITYKYVYNQEIYEDVFKIDFEQNTIYFSNLGSITLGNRIKEPEPIEINLDKFGIELYSDENNKLLPGYLCDFLLVHYQGQNLSYTSNQLYVMGYGESTYQQLVQQYEDNLKEASQELKQESIRYLSFLMDHVYGLKQYQQVESYQPIISDLFSEGVYEQNLSQFMVGLNDGHTSILNGSQEVIRYYDEALTHNDYNKQITEASKNNLCRNQQDSIVDYRDDVVYMDYRTFNSHDLYGRYMGRMF